MASGLGKTLTNGILMHSQQGQKPRYLDELRVLWNEWDPIGVCPELGRPFDEYDSYLGPTLQLLESEPLEQVIIEWLSNIQLVRMGLLDPPQVRARRTVFAAKLKEWYGGLGGS